MNESQHPRPAKVWGTSFGGRTWELSGSDTPLFFAGCCPVVVLLRFSDERRKQETPGKILGFLYFLPKKLAQQS
jgi:hypothetical protein